MEGGAVQGGAPAASPSTQPSGAPQGQPQMRTHEQASRDLDARVQAKVDQAERGSVLAPPKGAQSAAPVRGPDGKFLPRAGTNSEGAAAQPKPEGVSPNADEPTSDAAPKEIEAIKAQHAKELEQREAKLQEFQKRDEEWNAICEQALARIETQSQRIKALEAALTEKGGSIDPRDIEIATFRERERARQLAEERSQLTAEEQRRAQAEAQKAQERSRLVDSTKAALQKHPELEQPQNRKLFADACRLVLNGGDPAEVFALYASKAQQNQTPAPTPPRVFSGRNGAAVPKLNDMRDYADKWHARLAQR